MTSVQPVAHGGIEAKIGAKKIQIKKQTPVVMAVRPVLPPSAIPAPDSMKAVTGDVPKRAPIEMQSESVQYATVDRGKSPDFWSTTPEKRAMLYRVAVQSMISTYKNVKSASVNWPGACITFQSMAFSVFFIPCTLTTFLKKSNRSSPILSYGKYVNELLRL
jgi:hypothetical protein